MPAIEFLKKSSIKSSIKITADKTVANILRKDGKSICQMEELAMQVEDGEEMY